MVSHEVLLIPTPTASPATLKGRYQSLRSCQCLRVPWCLALLATTYVLASLGCKRRELGVTGPFAPVVAHYRYGGLPQWVNSISPSKVMGEKPGAGKIIFRLGSLVSSWVGTCVSVHDHEAHCPNYSLMKGPGSNWGIGFDIPDPH